MTMMVLGGTLLIGGGIAIAVDQDYTPGREHYVNSAPAGVAAATAGAVLLAGSCYLLMVASRAIARAD